MYSSRPSGKSSSLSMKFFRSSVFHWFLGLAMAVVIFISFSTPIGGSFGDVVTLAMNDVTDHVPVKATVTRGIYDSSGITYIRATDLYGQSAAIRMDGPLYAKVGDVIVADLAYERSTA